MEAIDIAACWMFINTVVFETDLFAVYPHSVKLHEAALKFDKTRIQIL